MHGSILMEERQRGMNAAMLPGPMILKHYLTVADRQVRPQ